MPLTEKGSEIKSNMEKEYGPEKGEKVFYASKNAGTISGVDAPPPPSGPPEDPAVMPPQNLTQPMGMTEPTDCSVGEMFGKQHDFSADAASPMGGLPQSVGFGDMLKWKPF